MICLLSVTTVGASSHQSVDGVDREPDGDSTLSPSERRSIHSSEKQEQEKEQRGHYRGVTFEDIVQPDLIASAPSLDDERKRGMFRRFGKSSTPSTTTTTIPEPRSTTQRSYPPVKHCGAKSRFKATVRALVPHLSIPKRGSGCGRRSDYEPMK